MASHNLIKPLKAVIFDIDGTLIDTVDLHAEAWAQTFTHFGFRVEAEHVRSQIGKGGDQLIPIFLDKETIETRGEAIEQYRTDLFRTNYFPRARPFKNVRLLFERIRADGRKIAVASSCSGDELKGYTDLANVTDLIDASTTSDDVDKSKPHPDVFNAALEKLHVQAVDAIVIGDSPYDAVAAGKASIETIGVLSGGFAESDLLQAGCIKIYTDAADILRNFDRIPWI